MAEERLGAATAEVEAAWRARLDELRQEQMHTALAGLQAVHAHSVRCLGQGRPVWTPDQKRRVGGSVLDDLLTASSKVQVYLDGRR